MANKAKVEKSAKAGKLGGIHATVPTASAVEAGAAHGGDWVDDVVRPLPALARVEEVMEVLRIGRRTFYRLVAKGAIKTVRPTEYGTSPHLTPRSEIARYLRSLDGRAA